MMSVDPLDNPPSVHPSSPASIDDLPVELLVRIFLLFPGHATFQLECVCQGWKKAIFELIWRRKTTITERDLDQLAPLGVQLNNLVHLVSSVERIDYFFFPNIADLLCNYEKDEAFYEKVFQAYIQLEGALRRRVDEGQLAFHPVAFVFLQKMQQVRQDCCKKGIQLRKMCCQQLEMVSQLFYYQQAPLSCFTDCPVELCEAVVVPQWRILSGVEDCDSVELLFALAGRLDRSRVRQISIEHLETETVVDYLNYDRESDPFRFDENVRIFAFFNLFPSSSSIQFRARKLTLHCLGVAIELRLSLAKVFRREEMVHVVRSLIQFEPSVAMLSQWRSMIAAWSSAGMLDDAVVRFVGEKQPQQLELVVALFSDCLPLLSLVVAGHCDEMLDGQLDVPNLVSLDVSFLAESPWLERVSEDVSLDSDPDAVDPQHLWRTLTGRDGVSKLHSLSVDAGEISSALPSIPLPSTARETLMPFLERLDVRGPVDYPHVVSLLRNAPRLRHLSFGPSVDHVPKRRARFQCVDELLDAIQQRSTTLLSLSISIGTDNCRETPTGLRLWLEAWLDGATPSGSPSPAHLHLRREVVTALNQLHSLVHLSLNLNTRKCFEHVHLPSLNSDRTTLVATHPQLCYFHWSDLLFWKREASGFLRVLQRTFSQFH